MANNKNSFQRLKLLDNLFQKKSENNHVEGILSYLESCDIHVSRRTIYDDIKFLKSENGYAAPLVKEKVTFGREMIYFYKDPTFSIVHSPIDQQQKKAVYEAIEYLEQFKQVKGFETMGSIVTELRSSLDMNANKKKIISFSEVKDLKGIEFLQPLFQHITDENVLTIEYQTFYSDEVHCLTISPYHLKQYNNRWFLFGWNHAISKLQNLPLDRIHSIIRDSSSRYIPTELDFTTYFNTIIGVTLPDTPIEKIRLQFTPQRLPYVKTKPLHMTQNVHQNVVQITLRINRELISLLQSFGSDVVVLEPQHLAETLKTSSTDLMEKYNTLNVVE